MLWIFQKYSTQTLANYAELAYSKNEPPTDYQNYFFWQKIVYWKTNKQKRNYMEDMNVGDNLITLERNVILKVFCCILQE